MKTVIILLVFICCSVGAGSAQRVADKQSDKVKEMMQDGSRYGDEAKKLVRGLKGKGITDGRILAAIRKIPRHLFIDGKLAAYAYVDRALPIERGQTISQPFTVAFQTQLLRLKPGEKVLEIGTGSGYQAAVLCEMGVEVYSIERHQPLHQQSKELLNSLGYHPELFYGDGYEGLPEHAPFDKILITAATDEFPEKLLQQLKTGGLIVAPIGDDSGQTMTVVERTGDGRYKRKEHGAFIFVPMKEGVEE